MKIFSTSSSVFTPPRWVAMPMMYCVSVVPPKSGVGSISAVFRVMTSSTASTTAPISVPGPLPICRVMTMIQVRSPYSTTGIWNLARRSTTGTTVPRRLITPLM